MRRFFFCLPLALAGCQPAPGPDRLARGACAAEDYQDLVGSSLAAVLLPADLDARILEPGTAATMDFRPNRMNIVVGDDGQITRVYCG